MENPIYSTGSDHDVKAVVLYRNSSKDVLYLDEDHTIGATADLTLDLFLKNMLIIKDEEDRYHTPLWCRVSENAAQVMCSDFDVYSIEIYD